MKNWLVTHAHDNIWCQPANDRRWIVKPERLSMPEGETFGMQVQGYSIRLPEKLKWFHVFQLGGMNHRELGITDLFDSWVRLDRVVSHYGTMITLYNELGRTMPLEYVWLRKQPNGNVILATEMVESQVDFSTEPLYIRFYNGAFRYTGEYTEEHHSKIFGQVIRDNAERFAVVEKFKELRAMAGEPIVYINGYEVDVLTTDDIKLWDYVEIVYDGLIESIHYFPMADLQSFHSTLDGKRKFLLHPPRQLDTIHFINDIDVSVLKGNVGLYFHQNQSESFRQVTHNDYSILVNRFSNYIINMDDWNEIDELKVKLVVRRSGMDRALTYNHNRIHELYKLKDDQIVSAMVGINSNIPEWQASTLEDASYNRIMAAKYSTITNELCTKAYGYNAASRYVGDTPNKTHHAGGNLVATLAPLLARNCTVYEYDDDGLLLGYYNHSDNVSTEYVCQHSETAMVEAIEGQATKQIDVIHDAKDFTLAAGFNYRFYTNQLKSGVPTDIFEDVTGTDAYSIDTDGKVIWNIDQSRRQPVIWCDRNFLSYGFEEDMFTGHAKFTIDYWLNDDDYKPLQLEPETLEIWMNGHILVPGIDYFVKWPQVVVCNKVYLEDSPNRHRPWFDIRCRGLAKELRMPKTGFVVNQLISNNAAFDVRDDKVVQIAVGGGIRHRDDVVFREDTAIGVPDMVNGMPYLVNDPTVPLREMVSENTYVMRDESRDLDKRVEDYLTNFIPTPEDIEHNPIPNVYELFSPIMNKVIHDMVNGDLMPEADDQLYYISTRQFDELMKEYMYLLDYEPTLRDVDLRYVAVHPHDGNDIIYLEPIQMTMVERINDRYLNNRVIITQLLRIKV